jgi:hypothetical protein
MIDFKPAQDRESQAKNGDVYVCALQAENKPLRKRRREICYLDEDAVANMTNVSPGLD